MKKILLPFVFASLSSLCLEAGTITSAGTLTNLTPPGNGSGDVADLDAIGSGGDGFVVFNTIPAGDNESGVAWDNNLVDSSPAYVTALDGSSAVSSGGWANYDGVTLGGTTYNTGGINRPSANGTESPLFSFELAGTIPALFTLGLLTDNSDNVAWATANIRVEGPGAISADQSIIPDGGSDLVKFDIGGGVAGEIYTVYGTSNGSGPLIGVVTFDSNANFTGPTITSITHDGTDVSLTWSSIDGKLYRVEGSTDLQNWETVASSIDAEPSPATNTTAVVDTPGDAPVKAYRVVEFSP